MESEYNIVNEFYNYFTEQMLNSNKSDSLNAEYMHFMQLKKSFQTSSKYIRVPKVINEGIKNKTFNDGYRSKLKELNEEILKTCNLDKENDEGNQKLFFHHAQSMLKNLKLSNLKNLDELSLSIANFIKKDNDVTKIDKAEFNRINKMAAYNYLLLLDSFVELKNVNSLEKRDVFINKELFPFMQTYDKLLKCIPCNDKELNFLGPFSESVYPKNNKFDMEGFIKFVRTDFVENLRAVAKQLESLDSNFAEIKNVLLQLNSQVQKYIEKIFSRYHKYEDALNYFKKELRERNVENDPDLCSRVKHFQQVQNSILNKRADLYSLKEFAVKSFSSRFGRQKYLDLINPILEDILKNESLAVESYQEAMLSYQYNDNNIENIYSALVKEVNNKDKIAKLSNEYYDNLNKFLFDAYFNLSISNEFNDQKQLTSNINALLKLINVIPDTLNLTKLKEEMEDLKGYVTNSKDSLGYRSELKKQASNLEENFIKVIDKCDDKDLKSKLREGASKFFNMTYKVMLPEEIEKKNQEQQSKNNGKLSI